MTVMDGNPHYQAAQKALEDEATAGNSWLNPQETALKVASVEATLALAHEQRTANLIAWVAAHGEDPSWVTVQIQERLGL